MISLYDVLEDKYSKRIAYMRISVDLTEEQISSLNMLGEVRKLSRAEMVRRAVADYLNKNKQ
jgi:metal-responsive CopG/Arc/MetJ family transcriptional regulator